MGSPQAFNALLVKGDITRHRSPLQGARRAASRPADLGRAGLRPTTSFTVSGWLALAAPAATPKPIVKKMSDLWFAAADSEPGRKMM